MSNTVHSSTGRDAVGVVGPARRSPCKQAVARRTKCGAERHHILAAPCWGVNACPGEPVSRVLAPPCAIATWYDGGATVTAPRTSAGHPQQKLSIALVTRDKSSSPNKWKQRWYDATPSDLEVAAFDLGSAVVAPLEDFLKVSKSKWDSIKGQLISDTELVDGQAYVLIQPDPIHEVEKVSPWLLLFPMQEAAVAYGEWRMQQHGHEGAYAWPGDNYQPVFTGHKMSRTLGGMVIGDDCAFIIEHTSLLEELTVLNINLAATSLRQLLRQHAPAAKVLAGRKLLKVLVVGRIPQGTDKQERLWQLCHQHQIEVWLRADDNLIDFNGSYWHRGAPPHDHFAASRHY